jgi:hypothetical protein
MSMKQTVKIRIEIGPGMPIDLSKFSSPDAHVALLMALFRALSAEQVYPGPSAAFTGSKGDCMVHVEPVAFDIGASGDVSAIHHEQCVAIVTLKMARDADDETPGEE